MHRAAIVLALGVAGCGSQTAAQPEPPTGSSSNVLTLQRIEREAAATREPQAARAVLELWRDVQYSNFTRAYRRLAPELQARTPYERFVTLFNTNPISTLGARPRLSAVRRTGERADVRITIQRGREPTPADVPYAFSVVRRGMVWKVSRIGS